MAGISGRLMSRVRTVVGVPAPTGRAQPSLHTEDGGPSVPSRSNGVPGNPAPVSITGPVPSPSGSGPRPLMTHYADRSHAGPGRGDDAQVDLRTDDTNRGGRRPVLPVYGSGGAAHGGIRPAGSSQDWANPDGVDPGRAYHQPVTILRPRAAVLHFNIPRLRPVRYTPPVRETGSPFPGGRSGTGTPITSPYDPSRPARGIGPVLPRPVPVQRTGHGMTADQLPGDYADPGVIGGGYVL